jgi:phospholipid/cholesterol/gamma-HCH transport system substrate-binding protein
MSALKEQLGETIVGALVAAVAIGFLVFALNRADALQAGGAGFYDVTARFQRVDGLASGADVRLSGVKIGSVKSVGLDKQSYLAALTLSIDSDVKIPDDSTVRIATDGLLGGAHVAIEPGGSADMVASGGEILNTQSAVDLITLVTQAMAQGQARQTNEGQ